MGQQGYYAIVSRLSGLALDVEGENRNSGARVVPWDKHLRDNQLWYDDPATRTIRSKLTGLCLDVEGNQLMMRPFQPGAENQLWERQADGYICNRRNNNVLDILNASREPGAQIGLWEKNGGPNQMWNFEFVGQAQPSRREFYIVSEMHGKVIDVKRERRDPGTPLIMWSRKSSRAKNQLWYTSHEGHIFSALNDFAFQADGTGKPIKTTAYTGDIRQLWSLQDNGKIMNYGGTGECLDIAGESRDDGAEIISYHYKGSSNQRWRFDYI